MWKCKSLATRHRNLYHLFERDCTVQRRNQKVVERAPAPYLTEAQRQEICELGRRICAHVNYECAGTVEFLMDMDSGQFYFIEVNPRVQVEHTVTEEVTGIDIVQSQILIAEGATLAEATGAASQAEVKLRGHAIQCRITTEDPQNNFIPDYGRLTAYRAATGRAFVWMAARPTRVVWSPATMTHYWSKSLLRHKRRKRPSRGSTGLARVPHPRVSTNIAFVEKPAEAPDLPQ
jgi:pyruvate carboxylase